MSGLEIEAVYENGVLKLPRQLPLMEGAAVRITIHPPHRLGVVQHVRITSPIGYEEREQLIFKRGFANKIWMFPVSNILNLLDLINFLKQGTERGSIPWKETADENTFRCLFGKGTVEITREDKDFSVPYGITLYDEKNNLLDELEARSEEDTQAMKELYDKVRRNVLHIDQAIEALVKEIQVLASGKQQ